MTEVVERTGGLAGLGSGDSPDGEGVIAALARLPGATILDLNAVSRIFRRSPKSVHRAVACGHICPPVRLFGKASWTAGSILQHIQDRLERAAREAEKEARRLAQIGT